MSFVTEKPKHDQRTTRRISLVMTCLMTFMALALGFALGAALLLVFAVPVGLDLFGINSTSAALYQTQFFVDKTGQANEQRLLDLQRTQAALNNERQLLGQTATQNLLDRQATQTANVINNIQQQTQIAINYDNTKVALNQLSTEVALNFLATRAAINRDSTAVGAPPLSLNPNLVLDMAEWDFYGDWSNGSSDGWRANGIAGIKSLRDDFSSFRLDVLIRPTANGRYYLFFLGADWNAVASFVVENNQLISVKLDRFTGGGDISRGDLLPVSNNLIQLVEKPLSQPVPDTTTLTLQMTNSQLAVSYEGQIVVEASVSDLSSGALAIQVTSGTTLMSVQITPLS